MQLATSLKYNKAQRADAANTYPLARQMLVPLRSTGICRSNGPVQLIGDVGKIYVTPMKNPFLKDDEYHFQVHSAEPLDESRRLAIIHDWIDREMNDLFRRWESQNQDHGLSAEEIDAKKGFLFAEAHPDRQLMIAHVEAPLGHDPSTL